MQNMSMPSQWRMAESMANGPVPPRDRSIASQPSTEHVSEPDIRRSSAATMIDVPFDQLDTVRIALVGLGRRQSGSLLSSLLNIPRAVIVALCDTDPMAASHVLESIDSAQAVVPPAVYTSVNGFHEVLARDDIDLVCIATPWATHARMAVDAMNSGKHVAVEVPAAVTVDECWQLVEASERNQRHCIMLENCCYGYNELLILNAIRDGLLGDLIHGEAAYIHDLREHLMDQEWRRQEHVHRNGNLYPTHGLGPIATYMGVNRGDRFESMVSISSLQLGLDRWRSQHTPDDDPRRGETYRCGDMNTSIIRTALGRTIVLQHDVVSPRPYSRRNLISGTRGIFEDFPPRIYIDNSELEHEFQELNKFESYRHSMWAQNGETATRLGGHGGTDFLMLTELINSMLNGGIPDMDVYDASAWSVAGPLSEQSVAMGGAPTEFPDFTRGAWSSLRRAMPFESTDASIP